MGHYGLTFWLPVLIQTAGVEGTVKIGFVTAVPYVVVGRRHDSGRPERRRAARAALAHRDVDDRRRSRLDAQRRGRPSKR